MPTNLLDAFETAQDEPKITLEMFRAAEDAYARVSQPLVQFRWLSVADAVDVGCPLCVLFTKDGDAGGACSAWELGMYLLLLPPTRAYDGHGAVLERGSFVI